MRKIPLSTRFLLAVGALGAVFYVARNYQKKRRTASAPKPKPKVETEEASSG